MDSEDSQPGSSASNSSSNLSDNSRHSTPTPSNEKSISHHETSPPSTASSAGGNNSRLSRQRSSSSHGAARSPRSQSKSDTESSSSSSSSSDNEDNDAKSVVSGTKTKSKASSERSSSVGSVEGRDNFDPCIESVSPVKSRRSSRNSSATSNNSQSRSRSRSNSKDVNAENGAFNICHEDLSDVSDMESDRRASSFNNSKNSLDDEGTNPSSAVEPQKESNNIGSKVQDSIEDNSNDGIITDLRQKLDQKKSQLRAIETNEKSINNDATNGDENTTEALEDLVKTHDEDALDFEAEEGECHEVSKSDGAEINENKGETIKSKRPETSDGEAEEGEELEEGEVSDEDEKRPEETEPKPVCRFYTRGQCTWGMSCRFLHPGVTDKGNYTMFDMVRAVPVSQGGVAGTRATSSYGPHTGDYHDFRTERPALHHRPPLQHHQAAAIYPPHNETRTAIGSSLIPDVPVVVESAWERGLRTAKEMMRKANKRKEQDMDFEDKKMNLTLSPDELEKDPYYLKERATPPDVVAPYGRHGPYQEATGGVYSPTDRFSRGAPVTAYDEVDPYGRSTRYRELPPHRMPQYEDERRVRPTREVIVQRVEPIGRGDEWNDPWMRSKSPVGRGSPRDRGDKRRRDRRSYSSNSSYSSSSSSQSDSSSESSRSPSPPEHRRRYNSNTHKSPTVRKHGKAGRSQSPQRRSRRTPSIRRSPITKRRGHISSSPVIEKRSAYSPVHKRKKLSPTPKKSLKEKPKRRHASSSSGTGSSDSSVSETDSESGSSSSGSSSRSREHASKKRQHSSGKVSNDKKIIKKDPPKKRSPISIEIKKLATVGASALTSPTNSISSEKDSKKTRREELLKQLRAVEDAIAKKRSKLT